MTRTENGIRGTSGDGRPCRESGSTAQTPGRDTGKGARKSLHSEVARGRGREDTGRLGRWRNGVFVQLEMRGRDVRTCLPLKRSFEASVGR